MSEGEQRKEQDQAPRPRIRLQRPGQDTPVASDVDLGEETGARGPGATRPRPRSGTRRPQTASRRGPTEDTEAPRRSLPFLSSPTFLLVLGGLVIGVYWLGGFFTSSALMPGAWPWEVFRDVDGDFTFAWRPDPVHTALGAFYALFFLAAALAPARRGRGVAVLVVASLGIVAIPVQGPATLLFALPLLLGLALAGQNVRVGLGAGPLLVFAGAVLLAANLFAPLGPVNLPWASPAVDLYRRLFESPQVDTLDVLLAAGTPLLLMGLVLMLLSVLVLVGIRGRWVLWTGGAAFLIGVLGPPALIARSLLVGGQIPSAEVLTHVVLALPAASLAFALPVAAGMTDAARREGGG